MSYDASDRRRAMDQPIPNEAIPSGDPRYDGFRVTELYAFVAVDPKDDQEGIIGYGGSPGMVMPLVGADMRRVDDLRKLARDIGQVTGHTVKLKRFTLASEEEL